MQPSFFANCKSMGHFSAFTLLQHLKFSPEKPKKQVYDTWKVQVLTMIYSHFNCNSNAIQDQTFPKACLIPTCGQVVQSWISVNDSLLVRHWGFHDP